MGHWGTSISSNDTYADVYGEFFDLYDQGLEVEEITSKLFSTNQETINEPNDSNNFWFALAKAQWECKRLDPVILNRVKSIIESSADIDVWERLDASESDIKKRKISLDKFLAKLLSERITPKARKKKIVLDPPFKKGDCLTYQLSNGNYGGSVVLESLDNTEFGACLIAVTRINQPHKPVKSDFEKAGVLTFNVDTPQRITGQEHAMISWYLPVRHKNIVSQIERIDSLQIKQVYTTKGVYNSFFGDFNINVIQDSIAQFEHEKKHAKPGRKITIKELIGQKPFWKF